MNLYHIFPFVVYGISILTTACDTTIHEYPKTGESIVLVELNVDRTPPRYYKELIYDKNGEYVETTLESEVSETYTADERLCMRLIAELYKVSSPTDGTAKGTLVARRDLAVDRLKDAPQDTLQFSVPTGTYRTLTWADYTPKNNITDWHFETDELDAIRVTLEHKPQDNHHKSSAAGSNAFIVDFDHNETGNITISDNTRATRIDNDIVPVHLKRASGRFRLWATDLQDFLNSNNRIEDLRVRIIYKQYISAGYNVDTETPNLFVQARSMETTPTTIPGDGTVLLAYDYVLTSSDKEDHVLIDVFIYKGNEKLNHYQNIDVPLRRNRETVIKGPFLTKTVGSGDIGIDDEFNDEFVVEIPD